MIPFLFARLDKHDFSLLKQEEENCGVIQFLQGEEKGGDVFEGQDFGEDDLSNIFFGANFQGRGVVVTEGKRKERRKKKSGTNSFGIPL